MADDLLKRLRAAGDDYTIAWGSGGLYDEAADEIELLRAAVAMLSGALEAISMAKKTLSGAGAPGKENDRG